MPLWIRTQPRIHIGIMSGMLQPIPNFLTRFSITASFRGRIVSLLKFLLTGILRVLPSNLVSILTIGQPVHESRLLKAVLELWVTTRLNTSATIIVGSETLGIADILGETSPYQGKIPIPPVMANQIELIITNHIQKPLHGQLSELFNKKLSWPTIYISFVILLHHCAMIIRHDAAYAKNINLRQVYFSNVDILFIF